MKINKDDVILFLRFILKILPIIVEFIQNNNEEEKETLITAVKSCLNVE